MSGTARVRWSGAGGRNTVGRLRAGGASLSTVEADGVNTNGARFTLLVLARLALLGLEGDLRGTSALGILDRIATLGAAMGLLADGPVRHIVVSVDISVPRGADLVTVDGHLVFAIAFDLGLLVDISSDALVLERTFGGAVTLAERVATFEAGELVGAVRVEGAGFESVPVVTRLLLSGALVVGVVGGRVLMSVQTPSGGSSLPGCKADDKDRRNRKVHF